MGPISRRERRQIDASHPGVTYRIGQLALIRTTREGRCAFLDDANRCRVHDSELKPRTCHRYPFVLVATPDGGRISTDHRCPCRSMGERPLLTVADAEPALLDAAGRLSVDRRIDEAITIDRRGVRWARWKELESELLTRLARGELVERVLDARPFPDIADGTWPQIAFELAEDDFTTRWARARQWAGDAITAMYTKTSPPRERPRPWASAFDHAEHRSQPSDPEAMLADWVSDAIWSLEWTDAGPFALARADLATRIEIARWIADHLVERYSCRADRAMAEAIAILEIAGLSDIWSSVLPRMHIS